MSAVQTIAIREIRAALRNRWILATTLLLAALGLTLSLLGSAPVGTVGAAPLDVTVVSLTSLTIFLLPLIALLLSHDAIVGEAERGTLLLLLSYPVTRGQIVAGKFLGHALVLTLATVLGYGSAAAVVAATGAGADGGAWSAFALMIASSAVLGMAFLALGYLVSAFVRDRRTAVGLAVGIWLLFALVYDMALLALLVANKGDTIPESVVSVLLLLNPADVYRMFNLSSMSGVASLSGMASLSGHAAPGAGPLIAALAAWVAAPLALAMVVFSRRQL
jgi:Cu-processing system permease protein